jgi:hypothetical protein
MKIENFITPFHIASNCDELLDKFFHFLYFKKSVIEYFKFKMFYFIK